MGTATEAKERPILFSGPMVKALLSGEKTQTRRVIFKGSDPRDHMPWRVAGTHWQDGDDPLRCPYGNVGDLLWVRETWARRSGLRIDMILRPFFAADGDNLPPGYRWTPSIHMPRWASRITLRITDVRVQRLNSITNADIVAEGVPPIGPEHDPRVLRDDFRQLWDSINGGRDGCDWASNPWVWAISFERIKP
jgi:hypothetical protein